MNQHFWTHERKQAAQIRICERIGLGESLIRICGKSDLKGTPAMPNQQTVHAWLAADPAFRQQYLLARQQQGDSYSDQIIETVNSVQGGTLAEIAWARLKVDSLKWLASKQHPKLWGSKVGLEVELNDLSTMTVDQLSQRMRSLQPMVQHLLEDRNDEAAGVVPTSTHMAN
ncbi:MAG: hypothetical protein H7836_13025 [Magnetococcus sp. YQC-3]